MSKFELQITTSMQNPLLKFKGLIIIYFGWWLLSSSLSLLIMVNFFQLEWVNSTIDISIYNTIFALLGLGIWFWVQLNLRNNKNMLNHVLNHVFGAGILFVILQVVAYITYLILYNGENPSEVFTSLLGLRSISFIIQYFLLISIYLFLHYYHHFQKTAVEEEQIKARLKEAELRSLKAQINPHFLFNSLNSASMLTMISPEKAQQMIVKLSDFFRYTLVQSKGLYSSLKEEIEHGLLYLELERIRFEDRLIVESKIEASCYKSSIPTLLLQPIFENAIKHGIYESNQKVYIKIVCSQVDGFVNLQIQNQYFENQGTKKKGTSTGLKNVIERLKVSYGDDFTFSTNKEAGIFTVKIRIPAQDIKTLSDQNNEKNEN